MRHMALWAMGMGHWRMACNSYMANVAMAMAMAMDCGHRLGAGPLHSHPMAHAIG